jgi:hypothetical protein
MAEHVIHPIEATAPQPSPEEFASAVAQTEDFIREGARHLGRLFGMDLQMSIGQLDEGAGMATNTSTGQIIVDPRFFVEAGRGSPDAAEYGILHETAAHLRRIVTNPDLTKRVNAFSAQGKPQAIFENILEDIAGNNLIHAVLPRMRGVAHKLYAEELFADTDYTTYPRHLQFLYKIIRDEMAPGDEIAVLPEVDEAIAGLRDYQGQGDVIKYSTSVAKSAREAMTGEEQFSIWRRVIYPEYQKLLELDRQDPARQSQEGEQGDSADGAEPTEAQGSKSTNNEGPKQPGKGQPSDDQRFGEYYADYSQNHHPEPMSSDEKKVLTEQVSEAAAAKQQPSSERALHEHEQAVDAKLRTETGHGLQEQQTYNAEVVKWLASIDEMRDVFQKIINRMVAQKRGLSRQTYAEGAVLDPDRLVQTVIDVRNHIQEPEAFRDYEPTRGETSAIGKTDYVFAFDVSGSMRSNGRSQAAASSAVIGLEGLSAMQSDIEEAEAKHHLDLELDIRTAIYAFGDTSECLKPLSKSITPKERMDAYEAVDSPAGNSTQDFLALEEIEALTIDADRRKILIVVSDGESHDASRARRSIDRLRGAGWFVYGISIGSDAATALYQPTARRVDDPEKLPDTIRDFIEATIS